MKLSTTLLGVKDINASVAFYEALGFKRKQGGGALAFMSDGDRTFALAKAEVIGTVNGKASIASPAPGVVLAFMARNNAEVDETLEKAKSAGGSVVLAAAEGAWGGYTGSFADPDGNVWAVIHNDALYRG